MDRVIKVIGNGRLTVKPDMFRISVDISSTDPDYNTAVRTISEYTGEIKGYLAELSIDEMDIKTTDFRVDTEFEGYNDENGNWRQRFKGYRARHSVKIEHETDDELIGRILFTLAGSKARPEFRISYFVKDTEAAKTELLALATESSRRKAETLCKAAGVTLGRIMTIDYSWGDMELTSPTVGVIAENRMLAKASMSCDMGIVPDDIVISDSVSVVWEII